MKQQRTVKHEVLERSIKDILTIVKIEAPSMSSKDEQPLPSVVETIKTKEEWSVATSQNEKHTDWCKSIIIRDEYPKDREEFINKLKLFQSRLDEHI